MIKIQEDMDKEWNTCRYCGITREKIKEQKQSNFIIMGRCDKCMTKRKNESDFEEAKRDGEITRDNSIMCPYCGDITDDDLGEYRDNDSFTCIECEKESKLSIEYTVHFTTEKN